MPSDPAVLSEPVLKIKFAVAPACPWPKIAPGPPWTISTRSTVSSKRTKVLESKKDRDATPYSGEPWIMVEKYGESPPPLGKPATSILTPVCPPDASGQIPGESLKISAALAGFAFLISSWFSDTML